MAALVVILTAKRLLDKSAFLLKLWIMIALVCPKPLWWHFNKPVPSTLPSSHRAAVPLRNASKQLRDLGMEKACRRIFKGWPYTVGMLSF